MIVIHHGLSIELPDPWWAKAGMGDLVPQRRTFRADLSAKKGVEIFEAPQVEQHVP
jgi:hypothetical protein